MTRVFILVDANSKRFHSEKPIEAGKKAADYLFMNTRSNKITFALKEPAKNKIYHYIGKRNNCKVSMKVNMMSKGGSAKSVKSLQELTYNVLTTKTLRTRKDGDKMLRKNIVVLSNVYYGLIETFLNEFLSKEISPNRFYQPLYGANISHFKHIEKLILDHLNNKKFTKTFEQFTDYKYPEDDDTSIFTTHNYNFTRENMDVRISINLNHTLDYINTEIKITKKR